MESELTGFLFPNDIHIVWSLMIVLYPYITGIVAGAFIVSSLYHVFGRKELRPVARLSIVASFAFLLAAPLPLLVHLGHPERALNIIITPHFTSAMAAFGLIYAVYVTLLLLEIWLVYRQNIVLIAQSSQGWKRAIFRVLTLGVHDISEPALRIDHKAVVILAALGIPAACILHGYVGFTIAFTASLILLVQVFAMRWNVVIGGQMFSKSMRGFRASYEHELFSKEGIPVAVMILAVPFVLIALFHYFLPLADGPEEGGDMKASSA